MKRILIVFMLLLTATGLFAQNKNVRYSGDLELSDTKILSSGYSGYGVSIMTSHGVELFKGRFFAGIGTGYIWSPSNNDSFIPAYLNLKYRIFNESKDHSFTPFCGVRTGLDVCITDTDISYFLTPLMGIEIYNVQFAIGFQYNNGSREIRTERIETKPYKYGALFLSLGFKL